ncbi:MAG: hypothetical protein O3C27_02320 [Actinomycetota bacterium]|nr:hypothetical protein [Actinomycetota bacterium]
MLTGELQLHPRAPNALWPRRSGPRVDGFDPMNSFGPDVAAAYDDHLRALDVRHRTCALRPGAQSVAEHCWPPRPILLAQNVI